ncbi:DNA-binding protein HEXBP-like [Gadus morhua]|uniref:DNA-binding protein HEXBP-like n=1 Tax=Gadus morhua TaxID=8049 RepID=UPI0011B5D3B8|nr:DNA-binding protein HEXBP-like [Gadus morhua]
MERLRGIKEKCGIVLACRVKSKNIYEITMQEGKGKTRQVKVCRLCIQPGHILRECPDFTCYKCKRQGHYARECDLQGGRRGEERTVDTEPAGGGERVSRSEEDQRQQDEDTGAASGGEMTPSTIGSSADGVSARASERRGGRPGEVEAPDCSEATRDGGAAAATASPKEPDDSSMEVVETRTSEEGESMDYDAVKASRKRIIKRRDKREPKEQKV